MQKKWNDRPDGEMNKKDDANEVETSGEISNERRSKKNQTKLVVVEEASDI